VTALTLHGISTRTRVEVAGPRAGELGDAVAHAWSRCLAPRGDEVDGEPVSVILDEPGTRPPGPPDAVRGDDLAPLLQSLTQRVTVAKIKAQSGRRLMLHAGALSHPVTGASLVFVAPGGTGKTTLARRLGRHLGYLTDETAALSPDGRLHPYEKPLSIRPPAFAGTKVETSPDDLALLGAHPAPFVRQLVLLRREADRAQPALKRLSLFDAITDLTRETSALSRLPRPLHLLADLLGALPPVVRLHYAEAEDVAVLLPTLLEDA